MSNSLNYNFRSLGLVILFVLIPALSFAQLSMTGEFRPRSEFRDGFRVLNTSASDPAFFISQRTRLNFMFKADSYDLKISAQDVRT